MELALRQRETTGAKSDPQLIPSKEAGLKTTNKLGSVNTLVCSWENFSREAALMHSAGTFDLPKLEDPLSVLMKATKFVVLGPYYCLKALSPAVPPSIFIGITFNKSLAVKTKTKT